MSPERKGWQKLPTVSYVSQGLYYPQLEIAARSVGRENMLVLQTRDLDSKSLPHKIFHFLNVTVPPKVVAVFKPSANRGKYSPPSAISRETMKAKVDLRNWYLQVNTLLNMSYGIDFVTTFRKQVQRNNFQMQSTIAQKQRSIRNRVSQKTKTRRREKDGKRRGDKRENKNSSEEKSSKREKMKRKEVDKTRVKQEKTRQKQPKWYDRLRILRVKMG